MLDLTVFQDIEYLYLTSIKEIEENILELFFEEAKAGSEAQELEVNNHTFKNLYTIESTSDSKRFKVIFDNYISYSIIDESYADFDKKEVFEGRLIRKFSASHFINYIKETTHAYSLYKDKLVHYQFVCLRHNIDVITLGEPKITFF
jgi:hypothetical protein